MACARLDAQRAQKSGLRLLPGCSKHSVVEGRATAIAADLRSLRHWHSARVVLHCRLTGRHLYCFLTVAGISTVIMTRDMNNHESVPRTVTVTRSPAVSRRRPVGSDGPA